MKKILTFILCLASFAGFSQGYWPSKHIAVNDAIAPAQKVPIDARWQYYDTILFAYRDFQSPGEVLSTYSNSTNRYGHPFSFIRFGGTLSGANWIGGTTQLWWFKNGVADSNLVRIYTDSVGIPQNLIDSIWSINDSTFGFQELSGYQGNILIRGTAAGGISSLSLNVPTSIFLSPVTFTNTGGPWVGTMLPANQSSGTFLAGPPSGGIAQPSFRGIATSDLPTGIPNGNLANSSINLFLDNTGSVPSFGTTPVALGATLVLHLPWASASTGGPLTASDWIRFNSVTTQSVISVNGQTGVVVAKNADSLASYPINFSNYRNGWVLAWDTVAEQFVFNSPFSGTGITSLNGLAVSSQNFATGYSGTSPNISSTGATHTFNNPIVNGADTGLVTPALYNLWNLAKDVGVDSVWRTPGKDSIQYAINGRYHSILDSAGGGITGGAGLIPLFTNGVSGSTLTFILSNAMARSVFGDSSASTGAPVYYVPTLATLNGWASGSIALLGASQTFTGANTFNGGIVMGSGISFATDNTYSIGTSSSGANNVWSHFFSSDGDLGLSSGSSNRILFNAGGGTVGIFASTGQLQLSKYITSTTFTGTPTSVLEVDASGNIIQGAVTAAPTLQNVLNNGSVVTGSKTITNNGTLTFANAAPTGVFKFNGLSHDSTNSIGLAAIISDSSLRVIPWPLIGAEIVQYLPRDTTFFKRGLYKATNSVVWGNPFRLDSSVYIDLGNQVGTLNNTVTFDSVMAGFKMNGIPQAAAGKLIVHMTDSSFAQLTLGTNLSIGAGGVLNAAGGGGGSQSLQQTLNIGNTADTLAIFSLLGTTDTAYWFGDSYTYGYVATDSTKDFASLVSKRLKLTQYNDGVPGSTLEKGTPLNPFGATNMVDRISLIPHHSVHSRYLFFAFGLNDIGWNAGTYDTAHFSPNYIQIIDTALARGWPASRIFVINTFYLSSAGYAAYAVLSGNSAPVLQRQLDYNTCILSVTQRTGVKLIDIYDYELIHGGANYLSGDAIHPGNYGHSVISDGILQGMGGIQALIQDSAELQVFSTADFYNQVRINTNDSESVIFRDTADAEYLSIQRNQDNGKIVFGNQTATATTTVAQIDMGGTYAATSNTPSLAKLLLVNGSGAGIYGFGVSAEGLEVFTGNLYQFALHGEFRQDGDTMYMGNLTGAQVAPPFISMGNAYAASSNDPAHAMLRFVDAGGSTYGLGVSAGMGVEVFGGGVNLITLHGKTTIDQFLNVADSVQIGEVPVGNSSMPVVVWNQSSHTLDTVSRSTFGGGSGDSTAIVSAGGGISSFYKGTDSLYFKTWLHSITNADSSMQGDSTYWVNYRALDSALASSVGVTTVGTFSGSSIAKGASISGNAITFGPADGTNPGMIKASGSQTLGATLTLTNAPIFTTTSVTGAVWQATNTSGQGGWGNVVTSGTYVPTLTNTTNISSSSLNFVYYSRNGNIVHVMISGSITPTTGATSTTLTFTLPLTTSSTTQGQIGQGITNGNLGSTPLAFQIGYVNITSGTTGTYVYQCSTLAGTGFFNLQFDYTL